jgi:hypothetical protein
MDPTLAVERLLLFSDSRDEVAMSKRWPSVCMFLGVLFVLGASRAQAQIVEDIVADIQYPFHVGNARFPAGKYILKVPVEYGDEYFLWKVFDRGNTPGYRDRGLRGSEGLQQGTHARGAAGDRQPSDQVEGTSRDQAHRSR